MAAAYLHLTGCQPTAKEVAAVRTEAARTALLRAALGSVADRAIIPMADWLHLGAEARINTPSTQGANWQWQPRQAGRKLELARRRWVRHCRAGQTHSGRVRRVLPYITGPETRSVFSSLTKM